MIRFNRRRDNRPRNTSRVSTRPPAGEFRPLFNELMMTRWQYEAMRSSDGSLLDRAVMVSRLQELRADLARSRRDNE